MTMLTNQPFGPALEALKNGGLVSRAGWNGKKMYLFILAGVYSDLESLTKASTVDAIRADLFEPVEEGSVTRLPQILIRTATGSIAAWNASTTDLLAEDWCISPPPVPGVA